jgi:prophage regulatory protein
MKATAQNAHKVILRRKEVEERTGLSCSSIYRHMAQGTFPRAIRLSENSVGWLESEIEQWLDLRITERDSAA